MCEIFESSVLSIYQDRLGRMWFGTEEGVNIFDGNSVTAIKKFRGMNPHNIEVRRISHTAISGPRRATVDAIASRPMAQ